MNPTDLLNTNRFMDNNKGFKQRLIRNTDNRIPNHTTSNRTQEYINNSIYQNSNINKTKQAIQQWPPTSSKTVQPILSREMSDLVDHRYSKYKQSYVDIDSRDGKSVIDPVSIDIVNNNYQIYLNHKFENVVSVELVNIMATNPTPDNYYYMLLSFPNLKKENQHSLIKAGTLFTGSENIFSKIIFRQDSPTTSRFVQNVDEYYNEPIDRLDKLQIKFVDRVGAELNFGSTDEYNHNFTLKIVEKIDVLKETLYDTRRGRPVSVGFGQLGGVGHV